MDPARPYMSLRIACDLDGTLADMDAALLREAGRVFGSGRVSRPDGNGRLALTDDQARTLWTHVKGVDNFWMSLQEVEAGAVARLAAVTAALRWEVIFLTQRPATAGDTAQVQSQRWLRAHGFEFPAVYVLTGSRGRVAAAFGLDAVIDDSPDNCLDVATDSTAKPFLVWRDGADTLPVHATRLGITVASSFIDVLQEVERLTPPQEQAPNLIDRVRRLFGKR